MAFKRSWFQIFKSSFFYFLKSQSWLLFVFSYKIVAQVSHLLKNYSPFHKRFTSGHLPREKVFLYFKEHRECRLLVRLAFLAGTLYDRYVFLLLFTLGLENATVRVWTCRWWSFAMKILFPLSINNPPASRIPSPNSYHVCVPCITSR
jgi:hypothetical protein